MKIIIKPKGKDTGIGIEGNKVYHFIYNMWFPCGDCKVSDKHIQKAIEENKRK